MTETEFKEELKNLHGGYLFFGGEDYLKYTYSKEVKKNVLDGTFDEFNHIVIYAEEYSPSALSSAIFALPMMADKKLVEIRGVDFNSMKKDEISALEDVLATLEENSHTILLIRADNEYFNAGRLPKAPSEIYKMMSKYVTPVEFEFPSVSRLRAWILRHFTKGKIEFDPTLCEYLVTMCGHDMWTLSKEIDKLCAYAMKNGLAKIEAKDIDFICCKTIEFDDFQLTNALLDRNKALVFETLRRQRSAHEPAQTILSSIVRLYTDMLLIQRLYQSGMGKSQISATINMHEFRVGKYLGSISGVSEKKLERAVELCREADIKSKSSSNVTSYIAVERLVSALCALLCK
ncbi:MAG: DNA polymerase III subunit delta [Ruminococcaceae bacterium]|nr:DNA polymerase III subunit delta [Oscillospiraceae bacterium]